MLFLKVQEWGKGTVTDAGTNTMPVQFKSRLYVYRLGATHNRKGEQTTRPTRSSVAGICTPYVYNTPMSDQSFTGDTHRTNQPKSAGNHAMYFGYMHKSEKRFVVNAPRCIDRKAGAGAGAGVHDTQYMLKYNELIFHRASPQSKGWL